MTPALPITHVRYYPNRTKQGRPTAAKAQRGVYYYSYGTPAANPERALRGQWYSQAGAERYGDVAAWAAGMARTRAYTYTLVLSLRDGPMQPEDFTRAMAAAGVGVFDEWRLIPHNDTRHAHAHVVAFREQKLTRAEFQRWRQEMGQLLQAAERERLREAEQEQERVVRREQELEWGDDLELGW